MTPCLRVRARALVAAAAMTTLASWAADPLSAADVKALLDGKTAQGVLQSGRLAGRGIEVVFGRDGAAQVSGAVNDQGTWRVNETGYCVKWNTMRGGAEACFTMVKQADGWMVYNADGSASGLFTAIR